MLTTEQLPFNKLLLVFLQVVAEEALQQAAEKGHWVVLQNVHLVARWLPTLERQLEELAEDADPAYRVFISAEPSGSPETHIIPQVSENSVAFKSLFPT